MAENLANVDPTPWIDLGISGAALFIVLVIIICLFQMQNKNINRLCDKIDVVITSFADNSTKLTEVIISNDKDQKQVLLYLAEMQEDIKDIQRRVTRVDTRLYDKFKDTPHGDVIFVNKEDS